MTTSLPIPNADNDVEPASKNREKSALIYQVPAELTFKFRVVVSQKFVGEIPGGYRVDLSFDPSSNADETPPTDPLLQSAKILSGNDWVAVTNEGIIDFDSRFTLEFREKLPKGEVPYEVRVPVSARLRGRASVRDTRDLDSDELRFVRKAGANEMMGAWRRGIANAYLPLRLTVVFDIPREGFSPEETTLYGMLREKDLGSGLYIGDGRAIFDGNPYGSVSSIELGLFKLTGAMTLPRNEGHS